MRGRERREKMEKVVVDFMVVVVVVVVIRWLSCLIDMIEGIGFDDE